MSCPDGMLVMFMAVTAVCGKHDFNCAKEMEGEACLQQ